MKLKVLGSNSSGNGYILQGENQTLLLEAGVPISDVRKHVDSFRSIVGCLVSHRHGDHAKYIADYIKAGIKVFAPQDVWDNYKGENVDAVFYLEHMEGRRIGEFNIMSCEANHDVPCLGYFVRHKEMGNLGFITDSNDYNYIFPPLDHLMIECNWSEECLQKAIVEGRTNLYVARRVRETHMGLNDAIGYIRSELDLDRLQEIVMLHLSRENSNADAFKEEMNNEFDKPVYVAENGLEIDLNLSK